MASTELNKSGTSKLWQNGKPNLPTTPNIGETERLASLIGGPALTALGLGITRKNPLGLVLAAVGGELTYRGVTRHSPLYQALGINRSGEDGAVRVEKTMSIGKSAEELYTFWRNFGNLPQFMEHLESVTVQGDKKSHWVAKAPGGGTVEWDAEITEDIPNQKIAWKSLAGAQVENSGEVFFSPAPVGRGTEVKVVMDYKPPMGSAGVAIAKLTGEEPTQQVREDLRHFKMLMETGQIITTKGQPSCRDK